MAYEVQIPAMGESVTEVILIEWLKADGEYVDRDEPICVLETDKANVDLPAPNEGILRHKEDIDVTLGIGSTIAVIEEGEQTKVDVGVVEAEQREINNDQNSDKVSEKIADNEDFRIPATIEDTSVLEKVDLALQGIGLSKSRV